MAAADTVTPALTELEHARKNVKRTPNRQIRAIQQRAALRQLAFSWFKSQRTMIVASADSRLLEAVDSAFHVILNASEKSSAKSTYVDAMGAAKIALLELRAQLIATPVSSTSEVVPDFSPLVSDEVMRRILENRWDECTKCVAAQAPLASIVMMGGLLEAMFVARANRLEDKSVLARASAAPKDSRTHKVLDFRDWTLRPYIDVGHELGWITRSAKDVAAVLSEYRNYIHPEKERRHGLRLHEEDTAMLWGVTKGLVQQLLQST